MLNRLRGVFASLHRHNVKYVVIGGIASGGYNKVGPWLDHKSNGQKSLGIP